MRFTTDFLEGIKANSTCHGNFKTKRRGTKKTRGGPGYCQIAA